MNFEPPLSLPQTAALALIALGAALGIAARQARRNALLILRVGLVACLALLLFNPVARTASPAAKDKPAFFILLDASRSMNTPDGADSASRWQAAKRLALENRALLDSLAERYAVRFAAFDRRFRPAAPVSLQKIGVPDGDGTDIAGALEQALALAGGAAESNAPRGGILLVSDGRDNGSGSPIAAAKAARAAGLPVYTLGVGKAQQDQDISVTAQSPQTWAAPNQPVELTATLRDAGIPRADAQIDLRRDGRVVQSRTVTLQPGSRDLSFTVRESRPGAYRYVLACRPIRGETNSANNRASLFLNVLPGRAKILLLEGAPGWDSKFLAQTLRDDPTLALDTIYQLSENRRFALSADASRPDLRVPHTVAEFAAYDVVLVGRGFDGFFDAEAANALKAWIRERGGNLALLGGRAGETSDGLRELSPVVFGAEETANVRVRLTDAARDFPGFQFRGAEDAQTVVQRLPSLIAATRTQGEKALTVVLARAENAESANDADAPELALLAYQRYGQGKVLALSGDGLWRWAFPPQAQAQYGRAYADFWTQTLRWLISGSDFLPGQNLSLTTDRAAYSERDTVRLIGHIRGAKPARPPVITLALPDGKSAQVASAFSTGGAGDFAATFRPTQPGDYVATVAPVSPPEKSAPVRAAFSVSSGLQEDANRAADPELMRRIAAAGGGEALQEAELPALSEKLRAAELAARPQNGSRTLWDNGFLLALLLALWAAPLLAKRK